MKACRTWLAVTLAASALPAIAQQFPAKPVRVVTPFPSASGPEIVVRLVGNNELAWAFGTAASTGPMYRANKVKYLAVAAPQRISIFPNVPTVLEAGGPANFAVTGWVGLFAPRGTPRAAVMRMNADIGRALAEPDVRERLAAFTFEPFSWTPEEMAKQMEADLRRYGDIIARAKISID